MRTLMLMLLAGLAGCGDVKTDWACGAQDPPPPDVTVLRVQQCWLNQQRDKVSFWAGTGFPISPNGLISFRHELPPRAPIVLVEGEVASVLDRGNDERVWEDWIFVQFQTPPDQIPMLDPRLELRPGERVALVGFPAPDGVPENLKDLKNLKDLMERFWTTPSKTIYGKIASKPFWLGFPEEVVLVKAGDASLDGLSGGPVMVFRDSNWVVVGVLCATLNRDILNGVFASKLHVIRRIPEHLLEK